MHIRTKRSASAYKMRCVDYKKLKKRETKVFWLLIGRPCVFQSDIANEILGYIRWCTFSKDKDIIVSI